MTRHRLTPLWLAVAGLGLLLGALVFAATFDPPPDRIIVTVPYTATTPRSAP